MKQMNNNISFVRETVPRSKDEFDTVKRKRKSNKNTINEPSSDNISECRLKKGVKRSAPNDETSDYNLKESSVKMPVLMERDKKKKKCVNKSKRKTKSCNVVRRNKCKTSNSSVKEVTISRKAILTSIQLLEKVHESKKLPTAKESCRRVNIENGERIWNSATNILDHVRLSILKHDWRMLSHLLQLLLKHDKMYEPIVKEVRKFYFVYMQLLNSHNMV